MCCPFTCCYVRFRCFRDLVRHVLDAVVALVFIKAPVLNTFLLFCSRRFISIVGILDTAILLLRLSSVDTNWLIPLDVVA